jgi:hypothetical protein
MYPRGTEPLTKPVEVAAEDVVVRTGIEHADAVRLPRLLSLDGEWRKNERQSEKDEPDQPHGHLGGGWLAGV